MEYIRRLAALKTTMIKALVFDFDGLILDTETQIFYSWRELLGSYGLELPLEKWALNIGTTAEPYDPLQDVQERTGRQPTEERIGPDRRSRS